MEFPGFHRIKVLHLFVIILIACGMLFPAGRVVIAQDIPPTGDTQDVPVVVDGQPPADPPAGDPPVAEETAEPPAEPPAPSEPELTEAPVVTVDPAAPTDVPPAVEPPVEVTPETVESPSETPAEVIAAAAEMGVTLVDGEGDPLVMADEETSDLLETGDPYYIATYGTRRLTGWVSLPVYEAYARVAGGCIASTANYTVNCHVSANPIQDAITAASAANRVVHIEAGDYSTDNLVISSAVTFRTTADIVVNQITLNSGANVDFFTGGLLRTGTYQITGLPYATNFTASRTLTSPNIFLNEGALLSDAVELVSNGGTISISAGTFDDESRVTINKSVEIAGQGAANTTLMTSESLLPLQSLLIINADDVIIHDLTLSGRNPGGSNDVDSLRAIRATDSYDGLEVYNTTIRDFFLYGIEVSGNNTFSIHDNTFENMHGIDLLNLASGIRVSSDRGPAGDQLITNNVFQNNDYGVSLQDSRVALTGNNFTGNTIGLLINDLDSGDSATLQYNRFAGNGTGVTYNSNNSGDPTVTSSLDWWGCNGGPGAAGCDTFTGSRFSVPSNLMFGLSADPTAIYTGETSELTAFMYSGGDPVNVVDNDNLPWFTPPAPALSGQVYGTLSGNIFTGGDDTGTQAFAAIFDSAIASATVDVLGDTDGDKVEDGLDVCTGLYNPDQTDTDEDGYGDECDSTPNGDDDEDGIDNLLDNCPSVGNENQSDIDDDSVGDVCDATPNGDADEDEVDNLSDNCPETWNSDQADSDDDGVGDVCDATPNGDPTPPPYGGPVNPLGDGTGVIPVTGGLERLSCIEPATLVLPGGERVSFNGILCDFEAVFSDESSGSLMAPLPDGMKLLSAVNLLLQKNDTYIGVIPPPVTYVLSFPLPQDLFGKTFHLYFWDSSIGGGVGGWTEVPVHVGANGMIETDEINFTGFFVLAVQ